MLVELDKSLHNNSDDQNMDEVISHKQIDHKEDSRYVGIVRILQHIHNLVPILQGRNLEQGKEATK